MRKNLDVALILPCYNEATVFTESVHRITQILSQTHYSWEIIFVDDASQDGTQKLIEKVCNHNPNCRFLFHRTNKGRGASVRDGIISARGRVVGFIDIDCEVSPIYILEMLPLLFRFRADVVIGRRIYITPLHSLLRGVLSVGYKLIAHMLLQTSGIDTESGYKFFNRRKIMPILLKTTHDGWFWDTEIIVRAMRAKLIILEMPVLFLRRTDKKSTVRVIPDSIAYLRNIWKFRKKLQIT